MMTTTMNLPRLGRTSLQRPHTVYSRPVILSATATCAQNPFPHSDIAKAKDVNERRRIANRNNSRLKRARTYESEQMGGGMGIKWQSIVRRATRCYCWSCTIIFSLFKPTLWVATNGFLQLWWCFLPSPMGQKWQKV